MSATPHRLCISPSAEQRLTFAADFLRALPARSPALLLVPSHGAATQLLTRALSPGEARFGWQKRTLDTLARELALPELARGELVPLSGLSALALTTRAVHELAGEHALGRYRELAEQPGFVRALAKTLDELRHAGVEAGRLETRAPELARVLARYAQLLQQQALADRALVYAAATRRARVLHDEHARVPLLALDVPLVHECEAALAAALFAGRTHAAATVARGDERSEVHFHGALGDRAEVLRLAPVEDGELARLQTRLFAPEPGAPALLGTRGDVRIVSSPGEARETVEVARGILEAAARGVPFDRMAILLRAVEGYRSVVEEALARAQIPAHYADGVRRPLPEGRAFLALLTCARDGLSARAFAEYLSLHAMPRGEGEAVATPRQWERMLVQAAVIGKRERWTRRIDSLRKSKQADLALLDAEEPQRAVLESEVGKLTALEQFATPILDALVALPDGGTWGEWIAALAQLARMSLEEPEHVIELLAELSPLSPVGPVSIASVHRVLAQRLSSALRPSSGNGAGKVFVGAIEDVRGRAFTQVFVTGLAERVFPPKLAEDPLLPDEVRRALGAELWLSEERVARERLLLRLAVGAASEQLVLSFPRYDVAHGRPRVPSFYGLEVLQAIDGSLPAFDELTRRAHLGAAARMGFPAPAQASQAIDDAEYDLAMLDRLMRAPRSERAGAANYLLQVNAHLARALRFRARRWEVQKFLPADGYVATDAAGRDLLAAERPAQRAYSASALSEFAACPYKFFLHAIMHVAERPEALSLDELDGRYRGILAHSVQRAVLSALQERGMLPLASDALADARVVLAQVFRTQAAETRDKYAPAIDEVFERDLLAIERDLGEWLQRQSEEQLFVPTHFELGIALRQDGAEHDVRSRKEPVSLSIGVKLRGSIDLVETAQGTPALLRATDYKTSQPEPKMQTIFGGRVLQPLLYALALEQLFPDAKVASGRLYFSTARAGFVSQEVALNEYARSIGKQLIDGIDTMVREGFLPAAPAALPDDRERFECERCAYRPVCGPYEAERVAQVKSRDLDRLSPLFRVRNLP